MTLKTIDDLKEMVLAMIEAQKVATSIPMKRDKEVENKQDIGILRTDAKYVSKAEAMRMLGISGAQFFLMVKKGIIQVKKITPRKIFVDMKSLERYLENA